MSIFPELQLVSKSALYINFTWYHKNLVHDIYNLKASYGILSFVAFLKSELSRCSLL